MQFSKFSKWQPVAKRNAQNSYLLSGENSGTNLRNEYRCFTLRRIIGFKDTFGIANTTVWQQRGQSIKAMAFITAHFDGIDV